MPKNNDLFKKWIVFKKNYVILRPQFILYNKMTIDTDEKSILIELLL